MGLVPAEAVSGADSNKPEAKAPGSTAPADTEQLDIKAPGSIPPALGKASTAQPVPDSKALDSTGPAVNCTDNLADHGKAPKAGKGKGTGPSKANPAGVAPASTEPKSQGPTRASQDLPANLPPGEMASGLPAAPLPPTVKHELARPASAEISAILPPAEIKTSQAPAEINTSQPPAEINTTRQPPAGINTGKPPAEINDDLPPAEINTGSPPSPSSQASLPPGQITPTHGLARQNTPSWYQGKGRGPEPPDVPPILTEGAMYKRMNRLFKPRADGSYLVPEELVAQYRDLNTRPEVVREYERCGCDSVTCLVLLMGIL